MIRSYGTALPLAFALIASAAEPARAQGVDTVDVALWNLVLATVRLSENYRLHLEEQARFNDNITDVDQNIVRWAVGRRPSLRFRLEQRFLEAWDDASVRLRSMARGVRPLDERATWSIAVWDEVMFTLDETTGGPARGFDQNRLFGGVLRKLNSHVGLEFGYL